MNEMNKKIKILVVEDSAVQRELLVHIFNSDTAIQVIGLAENGIEALEALKKLQPDLVLMDLHMPRMNGIETIRQIMKTNPFPIVAISASANSGDIIDGFHALEAGAVAFAEKPRSIHHPQYEFLRSNLLLTVKLMSEVIVIKRWDESRKRSKMGSESPKKIAAPLITKKIQFITIGTSTGGPIVLKTILSLLPPDFPPMLIVQHISPGFIQGLAEWLTAVTHRLISVATDGQLPERGHVYFAPDHHHMGISKTEHIFLSPNGSGSELCPSVDFLFNSVASVIKDNAMGILLTGMGSDGALGLKKMKEQGAITIAQNKETSLIYGMPNQAIKVGAAKYILTPEDIAETISSLSKGDV